jgi:nucleoporin p58/p45
MNSDSFHALAIVPTLRAQHASFMSLASHVAALDTDLKLLKDEYRILWREKTKSVQDPFAIHNYNRDHNHAKGRGIERGVSEMEIR